MCVLGAYRWHEIRCACACTRAGGMQWGGASVRCCALCCAVCYARAGLKYKYKFEFGFNLNLGWAIGAARKQASV